MTELYREKADSYFANARADMIARLETGKEASILELGCGAGGTGALGLKRGKAAKWVGIELMPEAAAKACTQLSEVIEGNIETLDVSHLHGQFDALILSEVLEHLVDPWGAVAKLVPCLKPGAQVIASSPNVAHWHIIRDLIRGRFDYTEEGLFDRTHLRWFTPATYRALFEGAGLVVESAGPIRQPGTISTFVHRLLGNKYLHLSITQTLITARRPS